MDNWLIFNTLCFGYMAFQDMVERRVVDMPLLVSNIFLSKTLLIISEVLYLVSFVGIIFSSPNIFIGLLLSLVMQFFINHIIWGITTGIIEGLIIRKNLKH